MDLKTLNDSRSAYFRFALHKTFFESYFLEDERQPQIYKILLKVNNISFIKNNKTFNLLHTLFY